MSPALEWLEGRRTVAVALALALVAVPTFAALFPGLIQRTDRFIREEVMVAWLAVACLATIASQHRESETAATANATRRTIEGLHRTHLRSNLRSILDSATCGIPESYTANVYLISENNTLMPFFPDQVSDKSDHRVFRVGKGCTGKCFQDESPYVVVGEGVSNGEFGLTKIQQREFKDYTVVAAVPIRLSGDSLDDDPVIGVLTVISKANGEEYGMLNGDVNESGIGHLNELATKVGIACDGLEGL